MHFLEWRLVHINSDFTEIYSQWSKQQHINTGSDNGPLNRYINCWLCMRREFRERLSHHRQVSDTGMHHGTCVTHVPWYISGWLTRSRGENVPDIPGTCATRNLTYLARGAWLGAQKALSHHINQCWRICMMLYVIIRPQRVKHV